MPEFAYIARDARGQRVEGRMSAGSQREVVASLTGKSLFPVEVTGQKAASGSGRKGRRVKPQVMAMVYGQMAALMRSGVPLLRSIAVLRDQTAHKGLKEVLADVHRRVEDGQGLAEAMQMHTRAFSEMAISMVRAGSEGGFLEDALERVAQFTEQQEDLKSRTMGALTYPVFLGTVGTIIVIVLLVFFVPKFEDLFTSLRERGELPVFTDWLLWFSKTLGSWVGVLMLVFMIGIGVGIHFYFQTEDGKWVRDKYKLKIPMVGSVFRNLAIARFCRVLGTLLKNGVPIVRSLDISSSAAGNRLLAKAIQSAGENIQSGQSLAKPLKASGQFPATVMEMIAVAEESNTLDSVLVETADGMEKRTYRQLDLAVRMLEPMMLLALAGVVLVVVIALLVPVLKMSMSI